MGRSLHRLAPSLLLIAVGLVALTGCESKPKAQAPAPPPLPTYSGPEIFHGTVGSMTSLRGYESLLVSGYGVVVNLPGTGSAEVPAYLRQWLVNEMRKKGLGSARLGTTELSPERVLADTGKSVVVVQGLIPPGVTKGTRFDVLVTALDTQTTSLEGGRLWTAELAVDGANPALRFSRPLAVAEAGDLYLNPREPAGEEDAEVGRSSAVVLSGGRVAADRELDLVLHQPSWTRSRMIADRINERFPKAPTDRWPTAEPKTDSLIKLNIPSSHGDDPTGFLEVLGRLYVQRSPGFVPEQAQRLALALLADPSETFARQVSQAWVALGRNALREVRRYYAHTDPVVRLAALETGVQLDDEQSVDHLIDLVRHGDPQVRQRCADMLVNLPRSIRGARALQALLDDDDQAVRIAAYESLAQINDPLLQRLAIGGAEEFKFLLDLVPSDKPLIYVAQTRMPRLVIFGPNTGFRLPMMARLWNNNLMLRGPDDDQPITVFYQAPGQVEGQTFEIAPALANLVFLLSHRPSKQNPSPGLDLPYSKVVSVVSGLHRQGFLQADVHLQISPLAQAIANAYRGAATVRPETGPAPAPPATDAAPQGPAADTAPPRDDAAALMSENPAPPQPAPTMILP